MTATADEVWDLLRELIASQKETDRRFQENERLWQAQRQENERLWQELRLENERLGQEERDKTERLLREAANIKRVGEEYAGGDSGSLVIATTHTQARYALPAVVKQFNQQSAFWEDATCHVFFKNSSLF